MKSSNIDDDNFLFIGGSPKAGTTSIFNYLAEHPQICAATIKEPGFFLDLDYPGERISSYEKGIDRYEKLFSNFSKGQLRMEATPHYLYSSGTPLRIKQFIANPKFIFILREPQSFLFSVFRYGKQIGIISPEKSFTDFVENQFHKIENNTEGENTITISMGLYSNFLKNFVKTFGREKINVFFYEELIDNTTTVMQEICRFAGINPEFYNNFNFSIYNRTKVVKGGKANLLYNTMKTKMSMITYDQPYLHNILKKIKKIIEPIWFSINMSSGYDNSALPESLQKKLDKYYENERISLGKLLDISVPWQI